MVSYSGYYFGGMSPIFFGPDVRISLVMVNGFPVYHYEGKHFDELHTYVNVKYIYYAAEENALVVWGP